MRERRYWRVREVWARALECQECDMVWLGEGLVVGVKVKVLTGERESKAIWVGESG
jgi:hypothetical protein